MPPLQRKTGAIPSPRHRLAGSTPHRILGVTPPACLWLPKILSMWLNDVDGDCVTAEEAFAKATSGILIEDATVQTWATAHGVLNGADLISVLDWMKTGGFSQDGNTYNDGPTTSIDWTNAAVLQNAIANGPVKIGVAATQLQSAVGDSNGWVATGFKTDNNEDHCVALCGYGSMGWLAQALGATLPASVDPTQPGYALYTWKTVGIIDVPSMLAITGEAWLRAPTTMTIGANPPTPDPVTILPAPTPPTPIPPAPPVPPAPTPPAPPVPPTPTPTPVPPGPVPPLPPTPTPDRAIVRMLKAEIFFLLRMYGSGIAAILIAEVAAFPGLTSAERSELTAYIHGLANVASLSPILSGLSLPGSVFADILAEIRALIAQYGSVALPMIVSLIEASSLSPWEKVILEALATHLLSAAA